MAGMTQYGPTRDVSSLHDEVERMLRQAFGPRADAASSAGAFSPALDVEESQDAFTLHIEVPGISPEDVEVSLEESVLTVSGERSFYDEKSADGFRRIERHFGRFHRSVRLPDRVDSAGVTATYRDGLLTIAVPKSEEAKPRRIEVTAG